MYIFFNLQSIIGKVRSRVSSILPNRLSKWFSPSTKLQNDSLNGSLSGVNTTLPARRRRRLEVEEEDNYDDEIQQRGEYESNRIRSRQEENSEEDEEDEDDDEESEDEYNAVAGSLTKQTRRDLNVERQPPAKRSRLNVDVSKIFHSIIKNFLNLKVFFLFVLRFVTAL